MSLFETPDINDEESESTEEESEIDENDNVLDKNEKVEMKYIPVVVGRSRNKKGSANIELANEKESKVIEKDENDGFKVPTVQKPIETKRVSTQTMVDRALNSLNEKSGSSVIAIKTYIMANYPNLVEKRLHVQIWKYLKKSIEKGSIQQNKQKFKLIVDKKAKAIKPAKDGLKKVPKSKTEKPKKEKVNDGAIKVKVPDKKVKKSNPTISADVVKKQQTKKVEKSVELPSTSNQTKTKKKTEENGKDKAQAKPKKALYDNKAVGVGPAKIHRQSSGKVKFNEGATESPIFEEPSSSKPITNVKRNTKKTKK